jgi:hypothetical protein
VTVGVRGYHAMQDAKDAANDFLSAIERGDTASAQVLLCDEARPDQVQLAVEAGIQRHTIRGVAVQSSHGFGSDRPARTTAKVTVDVTLAGGVRHRDVIDVEYEHQQWLVCGVISSRAID